MNHLVIAIFKDFVAMHIFDIEMGVESEPLLVVPLVGYLDIMLST